MNKSSINISFDINEAYEQTLAPIIGRASETFISAWDITFGKIDYINEKYKLKRQYNIQEFKRELEDKVNSIPRENFIEPEISKIGPPLEASKYYFEEEEIRVMFANLIASSVDSTKVNDVYPSFSEIIKQMSKLDALNLKNIYFNNLNSNVICQIKISNSKGTYTVLHTDVYLGNRDTDYSTNSASLRNLARLGLIEIHYDEYFSDEEKYNIFKNTDLFENARNTVESENKKSELLAQQISDGESSNKILKYNDPELVKGYISITSFGNNFCKVCL